MSLLRRRYRPFGEGWRTKVRRYTVLQNRVRGSWRAAPGHGRIYDLTPGREERSFFAPLLRMTTLRWVVS